MSYYIGLMSGTSLDGLDAALVDFSHHQPTLVNSHYQPYTAELKARLKKICYQKTIDLPELGSLDSELGAVFAESVNNLLNQSEFAATRVKAIGTHGQTIFHAPNSAHPFSLQIGDPNRISKLTGIPVIADFRRADIAVGGQGAPLVPAFHQAVFQSNRENRVIVNIGGIANITILPKESDKPVVGFDTGPGNTLIDSWVFKHKGKPYDEESLFGRTGSSCKSLLEVMLKDNYFRQPAPKSTGQEYFSDQWLQKQINYINNAVSSADIQATLYELTATTVADAIHATAPGTNRILVCGGGTKNSMLMERLRANLKQYTVETTETLGINPDWVEAIAFAWLAYCFVHKKTSNLPSVTGASRPVILGGQFLPD